MLNDLLPPSLATLVEEYATPLKQVIRKNPDFFPSISSWTCACSFLDELLILYHPSASPKFMFHSWCDFFDVYMSNFVRVEPSHDYFLEFCMFCLPWVSEDRLLFPKIKPWVSEDRLLFPKINRSSAGFMWNLFQQLGLSFNEACLYSHVSKVILLKCIKRSLDLEYDTVDVCLDWLTEIQSVTQVKLNLDTLVGYGTAMNRVCPQFPLVKFLGIGRATSERLDARTIGDLDIRDMVAQNKNNNNKNTIIYRQLCKKLRYFMKVH
jgi:hypothetical protein